MERFDVILMLFGAAVTAVFPGGFNGEREGAMVYGGGLDMIEFLEV